MKTSQGGKCSVRGIGGGMKKFELTQSINVWKDKCSVEEIDYSILLAHVFGEPIRTEQAFMYLFRRYGLPNTHHDS